MKIDEVVGSWSQVLRNGREIASYIESVSPSYVDEEQIEEYVGRMASATLKSVPISWLHEGKPDINIRNARNEKRYAKMNPKTVPPLVAWEDGRIIDGNHRYRVAVSTGITQILCYVVV